MKVNFFPADEIQNVVQGAHQLTVILEDLLHRYLKNRRQTMVQHSAYHKALAE